MADQSGRTLAEVIVATALALVVGLVVIQMQRLASTWYLADQQAAAPLRAVRDSADRVARDLRLAFRVEQTAAGELVLHLKTEQELHQVTYWLDGDQLKRKLMINYDLTRTTEQTIVLGLTHFTATVVPGGVRLAVQAQSDNAGTVTRRMEMRLAHRLGVMP